MTGPPWFLGGLADQLAEALATIEEALRVEAAPHGVDEWDERALQHALAAALRQHHEVTLEAPYPSSIGKKRSQHRRCDLVVSAPGRSSPEDALWLELKVARQRDPRYATQWRRQLIADLRKLGSDPRIHAAAIVLVAFTEDEATLARDLDQFESVMVRAGVIAGFRQVRAVPVIDRIGHRVGAVALWPL